MKRYKGLKSKADSLFSQVIRSINQCEAESVQMHFTDGYKYDNMKYEETPVQCKGRIECAHIISRRFNATRTDTRNGLALCSAHHRYFHDFPREFSKFISNCWAQEFYEQLFEKSRAHVKIDWQHRVDFLSQITKGKITLTQAREQED